MTSLQLTKTIKENGNKNKSYIVLLRNVVNELGFIIPLSTSWNFKSVRFKRVRIRLLIPKPSLINFFRKCRRILLEKNRNDKGSLMTSSEHVLS